MKKFSSLLKVVVLSALAAPLAFAGDATIADSAWAEPVYLSICGVILLAFGMLKSNKSEA